MINRLEGPGLAGVLLFCLVAAALISRSIKATDTPIRVPEDFPKDVPIYKNGRIARYGPMVPTRPKLGYVLVLETSDLKPKVIDFYKRELRMEGWTLERPLPDAPDSLAAYKGDRRVSINVYESQSGPNRITRIELGVNGEL